jgi:hypothetical protein
MRISQPSRQVPRGAPPRRGRVALLASGSSVVLLGVCLLFFYAGVAFRSHIRPELAGLTGRDANAEILAALLGAPANALRAIRSREPVPELSIDISFRNLQQLLRKREQALEGGVLLTSSDDLVPARIRHGGRSIPVKVRLKGDLPDHFEGDKWSLRIHVRGDEQLLGMRRLSIQAPATRSFQAEPIVLEHLRREGVLVPRYFFVNVRVNGRDIGLMALEEHFSKELLEAQQRREGVIVHLDEEPFFQNLLLNGNFGPYANPFVATVRAFRTAQIETSPVLSSQLETATALLRGFLAGELPASSVFDVELLSRFLAVGEVWGSHHMLAWHNLRFYLDPFSQRLEPIGFDAGTNLGYQSGLVSRGQEISSRSLEDPLVRSAFLRNLRRIAASFADGSVEEWVRDFEEPLLRVLHREFPFRAPLDLRALTARASLLQRIDEENFSLYEPFLGHAEMVYPKPLQAYLYRDGAGAQIELVNVLPVAVEVTSLRLGGSNPGSRPLEPAPPQRLPLRLPPTSQMRPPTPVVVRFEPPSDGTAWEVEGTAIVTGQRGERTFRAEPYFRPRAESPVPRTELREALHSHPFLEWDDARRSLRARPGRWDVVGSLVLPEGSGLVLEPGTELRFGEGEILVATGPLVFEGTAERPIALRAAAGDGAGRWGGIVALHSDRPHVWKHVTIGHTAGIERGGWTLTGGVTLRAADVKISDTRFHGNRAEDALNLVRSSFLLENVDFSDASSDALDVDFSNGTIRGGRYTDIGGDAIDVSGGEVGIDGTRIEKVRDKAVSVGEASRVEARHLSIDRVGTAAVSKDRSELILEDSEISDAVHASIMAYVKKPEYGPATALARNVSMRGVGNAAMAQTGSRVVLDGREIEPQEIDVEELYTLGPMRK